jgi:glucose dehydrogenase
MSETTAFQPQIKVSWLIGTLAALALFAVIASYSSRMTRDYSDFDQQRAAERYATLKKLREDAAQTLTTAAWVDQGKGIVRIPIDEAMTKEIDVLKNDTMHMCEAIATAAPAATPAATTNAAPASPAAPPAKPQP